MSISYYEDGTPIIPPRSRKLLALMAANAAFAMVMLFAWTVVSLFVAEPMSWATWMPISRGSTFEDVVRYPFVLLWLMPASGIAGAWFAMKAGRMPLAYACVGLPIVVMSLVFGWYYLTPPDWR